MIKLDNKSTQRTQQASHTAASCLLEAHFAIASGESSHARTVMQHGLALCKQAGNASLQLLNQDIVRELLHWSYQQGIESEFVQQSMQALNGTVTDNQPVTTLPVMIYCLGRFSINIDRQLIVDNCYGRNKPLELLKVLIAFGGRQVSQEKLTEILWPETPGDAAIRNFNTTLHRLRKVLLYSQALILKDGLLTLNNRFVQVDLWETERILGQLENLLRHGRPDSQQVQRLSDTLFRVYHGDFLGNEPDRPWSLLLKERLRTRMLKILQLLGHYWQSQHQIERAREVYERGLALDPLQEIFYQRLIQLHIDKGHPSHAAAIYEKCRKVLSTSLGVMPSPRTLALYRQTQPV